MLLDTLVLALPQARKLHWREGVDIVGIRADSREVAPGDLFVAVSGVAVDGHRYTAAAVAHGAVALVLEHEVEGCGDIPTLLVPNSREALAWLHAAWQGHPGRKLRVIGVTGTDGKTTTVRLIAGILNQSGRPTGSIDSVSAYIGDQELDTGFHTTTPDAPEVQAYLAQMVAAGMTYAVIESTSHGLAQHRVTASEYDVAVVTNITHEHLDYHKTYEAYRDAKAMLFRALSTSYRKPDMPKVAVLNRDDSSFGYLASIPADVQLTYAVEQPADLTAHGISLSPQGLHLLLQTPQGGVPITSPLIGRYNAANILAAAAVGLSQGLTLEEIASGVAQVRSVSGRMERIDEGQPFTVIVDFAHTPNALDNALRAARDLAQRQGRVIAVFGCAGLRDVAKRPWMGEIAGRLADLTVITAEDPRTESLDDIMEQIAVGCRKAGREEGEGFLRIGDRAEAIAAAIQLAQPGDVVILCGKGHERSMCYGQTEYPWSDQDTARAALRNLGYAA
ncbi:MAG: UDP-N-acetylmuramoyl-L-alanyl-D-glutamate--2,6-diaminopimelate ligase [Anaerolineales bacterium]